MVDDGVRFDVAALDADRIREDQDDGGARLTLREGVQATEALARRGTTTEVLDPARALVAEIGYGTWWIGSWTTRARAR